MIKFESLVPACPPMGRRTVRITEGKTEKFRADDVLAPVIWSDTAVSTAMRIWARKMPGATGVQHRFDDRTGALVECKGYENSVPGMVHRVVNAISHGGVKHGYFDAENAVVFAAELTRVFLGQYAMLNTPAWINVGVQENPQSSACFILDVQDSLDSLRRWQSTETALFSAGSGAGADLSALRPENYSLSGGGSASGPVSFARGTDAWAGVTKSGGKSRRAAAMRTLSVTHPDVSKFITCKRDAQRRAHTLIDAGYSGAWQSDTWQLEPFQNANLSVRVPDAFMRLVEQGGDAPWEYSFAGQPAGSTSAKDLWQLICECAHESGDPGLQFSDTINMWHTVPQAGKILSSNPCCLTGDTLVDTSEGPLSFLQLMKMQAEGQALPHAFSFDLKTRLPVLRQIKRVWLAGQAKSLVEVTTDKGITFRCTPEHRVLLHDGKYVEAQKLSTGVRLRKIARAANTKRAGRRMIHHRVLPNNPNGCEYQNRFMWEQIVGPIPPDCEVHHLNEDPTDDRFSNFALLPKTAHRVEHSKGSSNPRFMQLDMRRAVEIWEAIEAQPRQTCKKFEGVSFGRWNRYVRKNGLVGIVPIANIRGIQGMTWKDFEAKINAHRDLTNDRVVAVRLVAADEPVFDMEVEGVHNFGVRAASGPLHSIVVHNSEYLHLQNSACNLSSINLLKFVKPDGGFDVELFRHVVRLMIVAQDIIVEISGYPTPEITENSKNYRPLGLGHCNGGALLMRAGIPYDSDEGRDRLAAITSLMAGTAYAVSAELAQQLGPFAGYAANRDAMLEVIWMHRQAASKLPDVGEFGLTSQIADEGHTAWAEALQRGKAHGYRNSQATLLAPTGTIGIVMDCDTTGIEPEYDLITYKSLASGGVTRKVSGSVSHALRALGRDEATIDRIVTELERDGRISSLPVQTGRSNRETEVLKTAAGQWPLSAEAHIRMCAAVQPFLSGGISKTVNLPNSATVEDVSAAYLLAWKLGVKCVALYRDGCKRSQPLNSASGNGGTGPRPLNQIVNVDSLVKQARQDGQAMSLAAAILSDVGVDRGANLIEQVHNAAALIRTSKNNAPRRRPPKVRRGRTEKLSLAGQDVYLTVNYYPDGKTPCELFVRMAKWGSTEGALMDALCQSVSIGLQHSVPLASFIEKWSGTHFAPAGFTGQEDIRSASSVLDLFAKVLARLAEGDDSPIDMQRKEPQSPACSVALSTTGEVLYVAQNLSPCCGATYRTTGSCKTCTNCGTTSGGCG